MKLLLLATLVLGLGTWASSMRGEDRAQGGLQAWCVVTNHPINRAISADYRGGKVYFCSEECRQKFLAEPNRYAVRANYQLAITGQARQVGCPFTGKPLNPQIAPMEVGGLSVGFCCRACQQTVAVADYQTRIELVFGDAAFGKGYVVQAK
jgi:YHS domain-containing protein